MSMSVLGGKKSLDSHNGYAHILGKKSMNNSIASVKY